MLPPTEHEILKLFIEILEKEEFLDARTTKLLVIAKEELQKLEEEFDRPIK